MKISACLIVKNEERNIERCLGSMKGYVDEMIVVDTGSTDRTKEKAAILGASLYDYVWNDNFAEAKNFAKDKATGDWIIFLDADEYFAQDGMRRTVRFLRKHHKNKFHGFLCRIFNIDEDDDDRELSSFSTVRVFRNLPQLSYRYGIHEEVHNTQGSFDLCVANEEIQIYHTGYSSHIIEQKLDRNLRILLDDIEKNGEEPRHYHYLMDCYYGLGEYEKAVKYAKLHFASKHASIGNESVVYGRMISSMMLGNMDREEIAKELLSAMEKFPLQPIFCAQYAGVLEGRKDYEGAMSYYLRASTVYQQKELLEADSFRSKLPMLHCSMGRIYAMKNCAKLAIENQIQALRLNRYEKNALSSLYFALKDKTEKEIIEVLQGLYSMESQKDLSFLANNLQDYPLNGAYAYFQRLLEEKFHESLPLAKEYGLLSTKAYMLLEEESAAQISRDMRQMALALLLLGDREQVKVGLAYLSSSFKTVVEAFYEKSVIPEASYEAYAEVLSLLVLYGRKELAAYAALARGFSVKLQLRIGKILMTHKKYEEAISLWEDLRPDNPERDAELSALLGECFYYRQDFAHAVVQFTRAAAVQELSPYLNNLHKWSRRQQGPEETEEPKGMTSIIILTHDQLAYTQHCIESIRQYTAPERYEIIVVDNHSTDGTIAWLGKQKDVQVIHNKENFGFAKGCNQGIAIAGGSEFLLLNNDTIVTEHWLTRLKTALYSHENIGAVGPVTNNCSNCQTVEVTYKNIEEMQQFATRHNRATDPDLWEERTKLVGFCLLIKRSVVDTIGGLDEGFLQGNFEDDDYSYRILKAGYRLLLCHDVFIHHFGSVTFKAQPEGFGEKLMASHAKIFQQKWGFDPVYVGWCRDEVIKMMEIKRENLCVLEVGCACGATLLRIKHLNKNARVYGVELAAGPAEIAGCFAEVQAQDIETMALEYDHGQFDYILFPDVLEHLHEPGQVLQKMRPYLKPGGQIIASIPNVMHISVVKSLLEGNWTYADAGILDQTHLRFFTLKEIQKMFDNVGYRLCERIDVTSKISEEEEALIEKLSQIAPVSEPKEFSVYQYVVKAVVAEQAKIVAHAAKAACPPSVKPLAQKNDLSALLRGIEAETDTAQSMQEILRLCKEKAIGVEENLLPAIAKDIQRKTPVVVFLATNFYQNGLVGEALTLLTDFYEKYPQDADLVYALGYILHLMGEKETADRVLCGFTGEDKEIQALLLKVGEGIPT